MLGSNDVIAFVGTTNFPRAREFYEGTLGLRLVSDDAFALVFDANGVMLRVTNVEQVNPAVYTVLGWHVADIAATVQGLMARGVTFERYDGLQQDSLGIWAVPGAGAKVAWFKDPDGNTLSLTES